MYETSKEYALDIHTNVHEFMSRLKNFTSDFSVYAGKVVRVQAGLLRRKTIFLATALTMAIFGVGWVAFVASESLIMAGFSPLTSAVAIAAIFWVLAIGALVAFRTVGKEEKSKADDVLLRSSPEARALDFSGEELVASGKDLSRELGRVARDALNPIEAMRKNAPQIMMGAAAVAFILGTQIDIGDRQNALAPIDTEN